MKIDRETSFLLIVDMQAKLVPALERPERVVANAARLLVAAARLGVPSLATEHCPDGIGRTVAPLGGLLPPDAVLEKVHFSALTEAACAARFAALGRPQAVVAGAEAHVCVLQTTLALKDAGYAPHLVVDAISSRNAIDRETAVARMREAGVVPVTTEMVLFEWLGRGDTAEFKDILPLIKSEALPVTGMRAGADQPETVPT